ncbi:MAG: general secretion pathway protein GspK [Acidobacteria bacterium]|nr:general secretion pathway protein GspK [Acidobacteriota bacterium]
MKETLWTPSIPGFDPGGRARSQGGVILIGLLWILTALGVIALSFARESFVEVTAARNAQSLERSGFVARAGIETAVYRLLAKRLDRSVRQAATAALPDPIDAGILKGAFAGGVYEVEIQDESGKLNVNTVSEAQLAALIEAAGIPQPDSGIILESILDWRDQDTAHRTNGAEDDYYQALDPPYGAKNGRIDTTEELLLVRGVTPEYFYGRYEQGPDGATVVRFGLARLLTVYSTRSQVNVNYAPLPVLLSIPGMPEDAARAIYEQRKISPFRDLAEMRSAIPFPVGTWGSQLTTAQTGVFTLTAAAREENSKARRVIRTIISLSPGATEPYQTLYWNENVSDYESTAP